MLYIVHHNYFLLDDLKKSYINKNVSFIEINYKEVNNIILRILRKIHFKLNIGKKYLWLDIRKNNGLIDIKKDDKILFFDTVDLAYFDLAKKINKEKNAIFWCWNKIRSNEVKGIKKILHKNKNIFSFDKKDCKLYNINYANQFYWRKKVVCSTLKHSKILFVGQDKGRVKKIIEFIKRSPIEVDLHLVKDNTSEEKYKDLYTEKILSYEDTLEKIKSSQCLLEVVIDFQEGITLRTLESIFFKKKLITTNKSIMEYDFYHEDNILIIDDIKKIDKDKIKNFLQKEYIEIEKNILNKYEFKNWIKRFLDYRGEDK